MQIGYYAPKIFNGEEWLADRVICVSDGVIASILTKNEVPEDIECINVKGFIVPAFIDIQIYGAGGKLFSVYADSDALQSLSDHCLTGGTVLCLPTIATNSLSVFYKCINAVRKYWAEGGQGIYGLHLEGPWINKEKRGAHIDSFIHQPTIPEVKDLLAYGSGVIKMITLAPEECAEEVITYIRSKGIIISAGHSNATYEQATKAFEGGIEAATHLYNAMSALQHRAPGMVGAILNHSQVRCSVIPDGYHADYAAISIAKKIMGRRLFAITDAVTETKEGPYPHHLDGDKYTASGTLSGSALTMHKSFLNLVHNVGISIEESLRMCSLYPAEVLKINDRYGKIAPGYRAQFNVLDQSLALRQTII